LGGPIDKHINSYNAKQKYIWKGEDNFNLITSFLLKYKIGEEIIDTNKMVDYINAQSRKGNLVNWTVALINNSTAGAENQYIFKGISEKVGLVDRTNVSSDPNDYEVAKYNITDHRHELIDLSETEIADAREETIADYKEEHKVEFPEIPSRKRIKWIRSCKNGLLLLYPLNHNCQYISNDSANSKENKRIQISDVPIIGIAISFPENEYDEKVEYAVNEQFRIEYDYPEEMDQTDDSDGTD